MQFSQPHNDPQNYYWYSQGFSQAELHRIYQELETVPFQAATILGALDTPKSIRSSRVKWIPKDPQWDWLYKKLMEMAQVANQALWNFDLTSVDEHIQYTEYLAEEMGHYTWHQDIGPGSASLRKISLTVQLSAPDEYEGGELQVWQGADHIISAERGAGVVFIFPSYMMHRVTPITKGIRRSFVLWVGGQHYR